MIRKILYLCGAAGTWYLAGMYRSVPLAALAVSECVLYLLMAAYAEILRHTVEISFPLERIAGEKGTACPCRIRLEERLPLPAPRIRLTLAVSGLPPCGESGGGIFGGGVFGGGSAGVRSATRRVWGGIPGGGQEELSVLVKPPLCGLWEMELRQAAVWDPLGLFCRRWGIHARMTLAVFPPEQAAAVNAASAGQAGDSGGAAVPRSGPESSGWPREYRPGDSPRSMHWKLTARTDRLWSREPEQEAETAWDLTLRLCPRTSPSAGEPETGNDRHSGQRKGIRRNGRREGTRRKAERHKKGRREGTRRGKSRTAKRGNDPPCLTPEDWDAFYEVLSALVAGLLRTGRTVRIRWRTAAGMECREVADSGGRTALLWDLYRLGDRTADSAIPGTEPDTKPGTELGAELDTDPEPEGFALDTGLRWTRDGVLIHRFSRTRWAEELAEQTFFL